MAEPTAALIHEAVGSATLYLRGQRVMLGQHLAALYGVEPRVLIQAVMRNRDRFPEDFMFQLDAREGETRGGSRSAPYAFTEQGVAMLSSVLRSSRAVAVNIEIMRAFVKMRGMLAEHQDLKRKLNALERKYDDQFKAVFEAIRELMTPPKTPKRKIGFIQD
jgi:hypothetical protein